MDYIMNMYFPEHTLPNNTVYSPLLLLLLLLYHGYNVLINQIDPFEVAKSLTHLT